ncbi:MAG: type II toxin-antitoxin system HicB family antitoxin [Pedobacter sp.]|nr:type II toxin-antitoxin system HicB family antitoxin [Pedobacter sp.]
MKDILQYKNYIAEVHFSSEDDVFFGQVIGVSDLVSFEADSVKDLKKAFSEAVDDYISTCKELNKSPDKTFKGSFNVRIPSALHRQAAMFAALKKVSLNDFVKYALDSTVAREKLDGGLEN